MNRIVLRREVRQKVEGSLSGAVEREGPDCSKFQVLSLTSLPPSASSYIQPTHFLRAFLLLSLSHRSILIFAIFYQSISEPGKCKEAQ